MGGKIIMNMERRLKRLKICNIGCYLLKIFCISTAWFILFLIPGYFGVYDKLGTFFTRPLFWSVLTGSVIVVEILVFWAGILAVYCTSEQLGIRWRVLGLICGYIPILNLIMLGIIIHTASEEVRFERGKIQKNLARKDLQVCRTKYPILFVHGVFFRDSEHLNYWGRIPKELEYNGATVYYCNINSAASVEFDAHQLVDRIKEILDETGCEKINIIAHSKGGLDSRYAISKLGMAPYIASLSTVNSPHRGCEFADYLIKTVPEKRKNAIAKVYNAGARKAGDVDPDFLAAVSNLTREFCEKMNREVLDDPDIFYQSFGSKLNRAGSGRFPLNMTFDFVKRFDGDNDGLVGEESFRWGSEYQYITVTGKRGVSHADVIDLNRENIREFDVREFYVQMVSDLKNRGF